MKNDSTTTQDAPKRLDSGDKAPDFCLLNAEGVEISLKDFGDKTIILYFYPKDNTPGCTIEALDFSGLLKEFLAKDAVVIGVSPDTPKCHQNFINKQNLKHILLSDPDKSVASAYGAYGKKLMYGKEVMGIIRSTFIIQSGKIAYAMYNVKAKGHAQKVFEMV